MTTYLYRCKAHGEFETRERMMDEHSASCPTCLEPAQRIYAFAGWYFDNALFHPDGSYEER